MKKRALTILITCALLTAIATSAAAAPRWTYFDTVYSLIDMMSGSIEWGGSARTYSGTDVTATKCTAILQAADSYGWYTIDSDTTMLPGNTATASGSYSNWKAGTSYRVKVEAWAYDGNSIIESVGPFYNYYNT